MSVTIAPRRTDEQRLDALDRANQVRVLRAQLKRLIASGDQNAGDVLLDPPDYALAMKAADVLLAVHKLGPSKTRAMMRRNNVSDSKTLAGLSTRQRWALVRELDRRAA